MIRRIHFQGTAAGAAVAQPILRISENGTPRAGADWTAPVAGCISKIIICNDSAGQQNSITLNRNKHPGSPIALQAPADLAADMEMKVEFLNKFGYGIVMDTGETLNITGNMVGASVCDVFIDFIENGPAADFRAVRVVGANAAVADADTETGANFVIGADPSKRYKLVAFYGLGAATTKSFGAQVNSKGVVSIQAKSVVVNAGQPYEYIAPSESEFLIGTGAEWRDTGQIFINDSAATAAANQVLAGIFIVSA